MKILLSGFCLLSFLSLSAQDSLTILFAGDAMMHQKQLDNTRRGDFFDLGSYFANIEREVKSADIAVVNFEVPLGGEPYSGYPAFSAPEDFALALQKAGFDFFLLANNHCLDRRTRGFVRTIQALDSLGIRHIYIYVSKLFDQISTTLYFCQYLLSDRRRYLSIVRELH